MARSSRSKGLKDKAYLEWIRSLACAITDCTSKNLHKWQQAEAQTEAAHVGSRGLSQKSSDRETLPLCGWHHRTGPEAHHKLGKKFWEHHGLDRDALIKQLNEEYERKSA